MKPLASRTPQQFAQQAELFGIDIIEALRIRYRYLLGQIEHQLTHDDTSPYYFHVTDTVKALQKLVAYAQRRKSKPDGNDITPAMIELASDYPIEAVVEFKNGHAHAICHEDKRPSAFHGTRTNRMVCPVCDTKYNAIQVLMIRDGLNFPDAVRFLQ